MSSRHPEDPDFKEGSIPTTEEWETFDFNVPVQVIDKRDADHEDSTDSSKEVTPLSEIEKSRISRIGRGALTAAQSTVVAVELSPANEVARLGVFGAAYAATRDPYMSGLAYGGATFAIESIAGLATAELFAKNRAQNIMHKANNFLEKLGVSTEKKMSRFAEASVTLLGGTAVGMVLRQREDPERTKERNRKYAIKSAASLAGVCAVQGYFMGKGIDMPKPATIGLAGVAVVGVGVIAKKIINRAKGSAERFKKIVSAEHYIKKHDLAIVSTDDPEEIVEATELEQRIWHENDFGDLDVYDKYTNQSQVIKANIGDTCVGMTRMFKGYPELPPFVEGMKYYNESDKKEMIALCSEGRIEELGTTAVDHRATGDLKRSVVSSNMWRLAYRDARARGVEHWGIIMEPERVEKMNKQFGFTFKQLGPAEEYQGGDCAPFVMDLREVDKSMQKTNPIKHHWFVRMKQKRLPMKAVQY